MKTEGSFLRNGIVALVCTDEIVYRYRLSVYIFIGSPERGAKERPGQFRRIRGETDRQFPPRLPHDDDMKYVAQHAIKELRSQPWTASYDPSTRLCDERVEPPCGFQFANGTNGVQWHNIDFDRCKGAA